VRRGHEIEFHKWLRQHRTSLCTSGSVQDPLNGAAAAGMGSRHRPSKRNSLTFSDDDGDPAIEIEHIETLSRGRRADQRSQGGTIAAPAVVVNAVADALERSACESIGRR